MKTDMNRIAIYSPSEKLWGGGQIYIEQLCQYWNARGKLAVVVTSEPDTFDCPTLAMDSVASKYDRLASTLTLSRKLKEYGIRTIVLNDLSALWLAPMFRALGFKILALLHLPLSKPDHSGQGHSLTEYYLLWLSSFCCHSIVSVNKNNIDALPAPVSFVGNYVPDWFFGERTQATAQYDFVMVTRYSKEKNIGLFIELLAALGKQQGRHYTALLVGDGPERQAIQDAILDHQLQDSIALQPWAHRRNLPTVYDQGKCFVISSHHEGFATTLLEAHARGVPAIVTRSAGFCGEFVESYGAPTGLVFEPADIADPAFLQSVADLVGNHDAHAQACITKARLFSEETVLGSITAQLETL